MSKTTFSTTDEHNINQAISIVYNQLQTNFQGGYKLLTTYAKDSEYWQQSNARLNVVYASIIILKEIIEEEDINQKAQRFCGLVEMLEETKNEDLKYLSLSLDFLKNIDRKMGEA
ncbi:MAG: hypothetical protein LW599_06515 [Rickettsiaceae bacterium]|jgi:hypothetical protein|nr:hypothetical protein [Rickettsiaceae bacterium]